eukprot:scaffold31763_cov428-Skeletonema_menzelii.AAC.1
MPLLPSRLVVLCWILWRCWILLRMVKLSGRQMVICLLRSFASVRVHGWQMGVRMVTESSLCLEVRLALRRSVSVFALLKRC